MIIIIVQNAVSRGVEVVELSRLYGSNEGPKRNRGEDDRKR